MSEVHEPENFFPMHNAVRKLEQRLGVQEDFIWKLVGEDDWSFVVKLHALIESATTHLLTECTGLAQCSDIFSRLPLSDKKTGKLAFAKSLDLLDEGMRTFIHTLSELRNDLIHNARNIDFDLKRYANSLNKDKKKNFVAALFWGHDSFIQPLPADADLAKFLAGFPKLALWAKGTLLMWWIAEQTSIANERRAIDQDKRRIFEELLADFQKRNSQVDGV